MTHLKPVILPFLLVVLLLGSACEKNPFSPKPTAAIEYEVLNCSAPYHVQFYDRSEDAVTREWRFGDGNGSTAVDPFHEMDGARYVTLTVTGEGGRTDEIEVFVDPVALTNPPAATITSRVNNCSTPYEVDLWAPMDGPADSAVWTINGTRISTGDALQHTFTEEGSYYVALTTYQCGRSLTTAKTLELYANLTVPYPDFTVEGDHEVDNYTFLTKTEVEFCDRSRYLQNIRWDFGDGSTSNQTRPSHRFSAGTWPVTITGECNGVEYSYTENIVVRNPDAIRIRKITLTDFPSSGWDDHEESPSNPDIFVTIGSHATSTDYDATGCPSWTVNCVINNPNSTTWVKAWDEDLHYEELMGSLGFRPDSHYNTWTGNYPTECTLSGDGLRFKLVFEYL